MKGLITFEGCEGVGKSTQLRMLGNFCREKGIDAVFTREPGGSRVAESIRRIILDARNSAMSNECEALLYAAARNQHIYDIIKPALEKEDWFLRQIYRQYVCLPGNCERFGRGNCGQAQQNGRRRFLSRADYIPRSRSRIVFCP